MNLENHRGPSVGKALDVVQLPERPIGGEFARHNSRHQGIELIGPTGTRHGAANDVVSDIKVGVIGKDWPRQVKWRAQNSLREYRYLVKPRGDIRT